MHSTRSYLLMSAALGVSHVMFAAPKNAGAAKPAEPAQPPVAQVAPEAITQQAAAFAFAIEDDIPLPTKKVGVKGESAYPFAQLNVGQSFFVPSSDKIKEPWKTLTSMASRMSREMHPKQFTTGRDKNAAGQDGVRIWRKADSTQPLQPPRKKTPKSPDPANGAQGAADPFAGGTQQPAAA